MTFAWFMEQALYHPRHGYYSSARARIGREGDYFTNVSVGPLFGRLLGSQFAEMWELLGRPNDFTIVEQGAHSGDLARDVLDAARSRHPEFYEALRYTIVEPFQPLREQQSAALSGFEDKLAWRRSLDDLAPFCGVHFSNELIDSMPAHAVRWSGSDWLERRVTSSGDEFHFVDGPLSNSQLAERVRPIPRPLPRGYETEVNLGALHWIEALAQKLTRGFVVAVDYGFARDEFYAPHRTSGTLQVYSQHRTLSSPLLHIGHADMTAHVEWTSLVEHALSCGLQLAGFTDQYHFVTGLLTEDLTRDFEREPKTARALQTLLHPGFLGMKFQFLVLSKNVAAPERLQGLRFARDPHQTLGI